MGTVTRLLHLGGTKDKQPAPALPPARDVANPAAQGRQNGQLGAQEVASPAARKAIAALAGKGARPAPPTGFSDCDNDIIRRIAIDSGVTGAAGLMCVNRRFRDALKSSVAGGAHFLGTPPAPGLLSASAPIWRRVHGTAVPHELSDGAPRWNVLAAQKETIEYGALPSYWSTLNSVEQASPQQQAKVLREALKLVGLKSRRHALVLFGHAGAALQSAEAKAGLVQALAHEGRHVEAEYFHSTPVPQLQQAYTRLGNAWQHGTSAVFQLMRQGAVDVNAQHGTGTTALHAAAGNGWREAVSELLASGADSTTRDGQGNTPLHQALRAGHLQAASLLIPRTAADAVNNSGETLLHVATQASNPQTLAWLCKQYEPSAVQAWLGARDNYGQTALHLTFSKASCANARTLLTLGADINARTNSQHTPLSLHLFNTSGSTQSNMTALAFEPRWRMDFNATDTRRNTLLHVLLSDRSAGYRAIEAVGCLLTSNKQPKDADLRVPNDEGNTALRLLSLPSIKDRYGPTFRASKRWNRQRPPHLTENEHRLLTS